MKLYSYCNVEGLTDVGCMRANNEDWLAHFECQNGLVAVVCDGMGGRAGGEVASHLAVDAIKACLEGRLFANADEAIVEACRAANSAILRMAAERPELQGMGSTCVMLIVRDGLAHIGSIGDSRAYLARSKTITQLTKDQSYVQMLVDAGQITKEQAEHHPRRNQITNALGLAEMRDAAVLPPIAPEAGDCFLLCSDGLSGMVSDDEILKIASNQTALPQRERVAALIDKAKANGGNDNVTAMIVEFSITPKRPKTKKEKAKLAIAWAAAAAVLIAIGAACWRIACANRDYDDYVAQESVYLKQMRSNPYCRIVDTGDTLLYATDKPFMRIEPAGDEGVLLCLSDYRGAADTIVIADEGVTVKSLKINPEDNIDIAVDGEAKSLAFNKNDYAQGDFSISYDKGDSTIVHLFAVRLPKAKKNEDTRRPEPKAKTKPDKAANAAPRPDLPAGSCQEAAVTVPAKGERAIKVVSSAGADTDELVHTDYAIQICGEGREWYAYECANRHDCFVTVYCSKMPADDGYIAIPLDTKDTEPVKTLLIHVTKQK